jgi:adenylate cyclase
MGDKELRQRIGRDRSDFIVLDELAAEGHMDFIAMAHRFGSGGVIDEMDCVYTNWTTQKSCGFDAANCAALRDSRRH